MSNMIQKMQEKRAQSGIGSGILFKNQSGKYSVLVPVTKVPGIRGDSDSIDIEVTTSDTTTQIEGMKKLEKQEFEVYHHRDNMRRFTKLEGKVLDIICYHGDRTGEKFSATLSYKIGEATNGEATKATIAVTPVYYYGYVDDIKPLFQQTALFASDVPAIAVVDPDTKKFELDIEMDPVGATFTVTSEATGIATATVTDNKLVITGVAEGTTAVVLKSNHADCESWETTIVVDVPKITTGA